MTRTSPNINPPRALLALLLLGAIACPSDRDASDAPAEAPSSPAAEAAAAAAPVADPASAAPEASAAAAAPSAEELASVARAVLATRAIGDDDEDPGAALAAIDMTVPEYEQLMFSIAADPELTTRYLGDLAPEP